jgi:hypothetical protein
MRTSWLRTFGRLWPSGSGQCSDSCVMCVISVIPAAKVVVFGGALNSKLGSVVQFRSPDWLRSRRFAVADEQQRRPWAHEARLATDNGPPPVNARIRQAQPAHRRMPAAPH